MSIEVLDTPTTEMTPHVLQLVDPGAQRHALQTGAYLSSDNTGWATSRDLDGAMVFPSWKLAHRFARRFLLADGHSWLPVSAPDRTSNIPGTGISCRSCGCTEAFACPGRCSWQEPGLCSECGASDPMVTWVVYDRPLDFPDAAVARKFLDGVPTTELLTAATLAELRKLQPDYVVSITRHPSDPASVVEVWI